jgi:hypothetical protein
LPNNMDAASALLLLFRLAGLGCAWEAMVGERE